MTTAQLDPSTATHLDGPKLVDWLYDRGALPRDGLKGFVGKRWESQVRRWRKGRAVRIGTADEFLLSLGVQLGEVPEECYRHVPGPRAIQVTEEEADRMAALRSRGLSIGEIARQIERDHNSVKLHLRKAGIA